MSFLPTSRVLGTVLAVAAALVAAPAAQAAPSAKPSKPTVVLVHGAWADGSSWAGVTRTLQRDGYTVAAPPNPLRGLQADAGYLSSYLSTVKGPIVLAGHSYGGAVITEAATGNPNVKALVYVDAFIPDTGDSVLSLLTPKGQPGPDPNALFDSVPFPGAPEGVSDWYFKPAAFPSALANDLPKRQAAVLAATQRPIAANAFIEKTGTPAWRTIPSWSVIGTEDHILPVALQTFMSTRAKAHITKVKASHLSLISQPAAVAKVIRSAAHDKR